MSNIYCEYRGAKYKAKKRNTSIIITSKEKHDGFTNYIDVLGKEHMDLFMKNVAVDDIDALYQEIILINYKGRFYQLFAGKIFQNDVRSNVYTIWTDSEQLAKEYEFEKKEQFIFIKDIKREDIVAIKIIKKPVLKNKDMEVTEEILEGTNLDEWLEGLI